MKSYDWFDKKSPYAADVASLPLRSCRAAAQAQAAIQAWVDLYNPTKHFRPVCGWRSVEGNRAAGGEFDSLHLVGLARDFDSDEPLIVPSFLQIVNHGPSRTGGCIYHVQFCACLSLRQKMFRLFGVK